MMKLALTGLIGGAIGGILVWLFQGHSFRFMPDGMTYTELAATLLAASALILTVLGVVIGLIAIWGFKYFKDVASESANASAKMEVGSQIKDGELKIHIENIVSEFLDAGFKSGGELRKMMKEQFDRTAYSATEKKWAEVDQVGDEND